MTADDLTVARPGKIDLRVPREPFGFSPRARAVTAGRVVLVLDRTSAGTRTVREFVESNGSLVESPPMEEWEQSLIALCIFGVPDAAAVGVARL